MTTARKKNGQFSAVLLFFLVLLPATALAFWQGYSAGLTFSGLSVTMTVNLHAASMALWLIMLAVQAWFVNTGRMRWHRLLGKTSYVIAPAIVVLFFLTMFELLGRTALPIEASTARIESFNWGAMTGFAVCWALAIVNRKRTSNHMRYMISTAFVVGNAIVTRILLSWFSWVPGFENLDVVIAVTGTIVAGPLILMIRADHKSGHSPSPYWVPFGFLTFMYAGYYGFGYSDTWVSFVNWFAAFAHG